MMRRKGLSQTEIANRMGVSQTQFSKWMTGKCSMRMDNFIALADAIGIKPSELLALDGL